MKEKQIIKMLEEIKNDPAYGGEFDFGKTWEKFAKDYGFDVDAPTVKYTWRDYLETYTWQFTHTMLRPLGAAVAVFVFAITGWISVANASARALPGDSLYPVKLSMERASLVLAISSHSRASLQVEFASRRLEEMVELSLLNRDGSAQVQVAVDRFKEEVGTIKEELKTSKELAKAVGRKTEVYSSTVAASAPQLAPQVEEILEETKEEAVEVFIAANEEEPDEETVRELDLALQTEIDALLVEYGEGAQKSVDAAKVLQEEGNYRRAFQVLKEYRVNN